MLPLLSLSCCCCFCCSTESEIMKIKECEGMICGTISLKLNPNNWAPLPSLSRGFAFRWIDIDDVVGPHLKYLNITHSYTSLHLSRGSPFRLCRTSLLGPFFSFSFFFLISKKLKKSRVISDIFFSSEIM